MLGIVEGFYGEPWSFRKRRSVIRFMEMAGLDTYVYAPKDDKYHRVMWRKRYPEDLVERFRDIIDYSHRYGVKFIYSISPGIDIDYDSQHDIEALIGKLSFFIGLGADYVAVLFDDIKPEVRSRRFKTLAEAQANVVNTVIDRLGSERLIMCPTYYWGYRQDYLTQLADILDRKIDIMWTGTHVVSPIIGVEEIERFIKITRRPPFIWDNYPVNDFFRVRGVLRLHLGGYIGRDPRILEHVSGYVFNPMNEAEASKISIYTALKALGRSRLESHDYSNPISLFLGIENLYDEIEMFIDLNSASPIDPEADMVIDEHNADRVYRSISLLKDKIENRELINEIKPFLDALIIIAKTVKYGGKIREPLVFGGYQIQTAGLYSPPISDSSMIFVLGHSKRSFPPWLEK
jgi:hyaluronoglucosaminidase